MASRIPGGSTFGKPEKLNPRGRNTDFLIYCEKEGGKYEAIGSWTLEKFNELKKRRYFELRTSGLKQDKIYPTFAAFVKGVDNWDFVAEEISTGKTTLHQWIRRKIFGKKIK